MKIKEEFIQVVKEITDDILEIIEKLLQRFKELFCHHNWMYFCDTISHTQIKSRRCKKCGREEKFKNYIWKRTGFCHMIWLWKN